MGKTTVYAYDLQTTQVINIIFSLNSWKKQICAYLNASMSAKSMFCQLLSKHTVYMYFHGAFIVQGIYCKPMFQTDGTKDTVYILKYKLRIFSLPKITKVSKTQIKKLHNFIYSTLECFYPFEIQAITSSLEFL